MAADIAAAFFTENLLRSLLFVICSFSAISFFRRVWEFRQPESMKSLKQLPGGLPYFLGMLGGQTLLTDLTKIYSYLPKWTREMGYEDFTVFWIGEHVHVMTKPEDVNYVLTNRPSMFIRLELLERLFRQTRLDGNLFTAEAPEWGPIKRLVAPPFSVQNVTSMLPSVSEMHERMINKWTKQARAGESVEVKEDAMEFSLSVISLVGFGKDIKSFLPESDKQLIHAVKNYFGVMAKLSFDPIYDLLWRYSPYLPSRSAFYETDRYTEKVLIKFMEDNKAGGDDVGAKGGKGLLMRKMMAHLDEQEKRSTVSKNAAQAEAEAKAQRQQVINNMKTFFIAGRDTTANVITNAVHFLAINPDKQAKLQKELDDVLGKEMSPTTTEQIEKLVYTRAVFQESLRMRNPVDSLWFKAKKPFTLPSGKSHPAGVMVACAFMSFMEQGTFFAKTEEFIPERWLSDEEREKALGKNAAHDTNAMWGFGGGPRMCVGKDLAILEGIISIGSVFKTFDVKPDPSHPPPTRVSEFTTSMDAVYVLLKERPL